MLTRQFQFSNVNINFFIQHTMIKIKICIVGVFGTERRVD